MKKSSGQGRHAARLPSTSFPPPWIARTDPADVRMDTMCAAGHLVPPQTELARMRGRSYWKVGAFDSALQWFERLDMWEDMVQCHILGTKKGERESAQLLL